MYKGKSVGVVVPAYNEEKLIGRVLETMPELVDKVIVVDDRSTDGTAGVVEKQAEALSRTVELVRHERNGGVGASIGTGYRKALEDGLDVVAVMAGDAQMDPADLSQVLDPVVDGEADYAKGNRLFAGNAWRMIPKHRYLGNSVLSLLTKIATGYWHIADSQSGYAAISREALSAINLDKLYRRYGVPNDLLGRLNVANQRVKDVHVTPVYNIGERSDMKFTRIVFTIPFLLLRIFCWRLVQKYVIRDFHPLVFFYLSGILFSFGGTVFGLVMLVGDLFGKFSIGYGWMILCAMLIISGIQSVFFAMWFDMDYNRSLCIR